jgi:hypothetical protein
MSRLFLSRNVEDGNGRAGPLEYETLNYDIVNTGREALAQVITSLEHELAGAVGQLQRCGGRYVLFGGPL